MPKQEAAIECLAFDGRFNTDAINRVVCGGRDSLPGAPGAFDFAWIPVVSLALASRAVVCILPEGNSLVVAWCPRRRPGRVDSAAGTLCSRCKETP